MTSEVEKLIIELDPTADRKIRTAIAKTFGQKQVDAAGFGYRLSIKDR